MGLLLLSTGQRCLAEGLNNRAGKSELPGAERGWRQCQQRHQHGARICRPVRLRRDPAEGPRETPVTHDATARVPGCSWGGDLGVGTMTGQVWN